jgi:hypothetical protein
MADNYKWGQLAWSTGDWGLQEPVLNGWGAYGYGLSEWNSNNLSVIVSVTGQELNTTLNSVSISAEINSGWGRLTWGQNDWGGEGLSVSVATTGQELTTTLNSVSLDLNSVASLTGQELTVEEGIVDPNPDVILEGQQLTITLDSVNINADGLTSVTGQLLSTSLGTAVLDANTIAEPTGLSLTMPVPGDVVIGAVVVVELIGNGITVAEGEVDPGPDVVLDGQEINLSLNSVSIDISVDVIPSSIQLNTSLGDLGFASTGSVTLTGNALTLSLNSVNIQIWTEVNTGTSVNYTEVNTGTDATWIEVDTAA